MIRHGPGVASLYVEPDHIRGGEPVRVYRVVARLIASELTAFCAGVQENRSLILTTHSMEECEVSRSEALFGLRMAAFTDLFVFLLRRSARG